MMMVHLCTRSSVGSVCVVCACMPHTHVYVVCMCTYVDVWMSRKCVCVYIWMCEKETLFMCIQMCVDTKPKISIFMCHPSCVLRHGLLLAWVLQLQLAWLASLLENPSLSVSPSLNHKYMQLCCPLTRVLEVVVQTSGLSLCQQLLPQPPQKVFHRMNDSIYTLCGCGQYS